MRLYVRGFTLIELLVVIAIIGILSTVVLASLSEARTRAKVASTQEQLTQIRTGIVRLELDTDRSISGCPIGGNTDFDGNEVSLSLTNSQTGLYTKPTVGSIGGNCYWTAADVAEWNGPYIATPNDAWGRPFWYDPDYYPRRECGAPSVNHYPAISSGGINGVNGAAQPEGPYDCDDQYILLD